jgi:hypothetical protein
MTRPALQGLARSVAEVVFPSPKHRPVVDDDIIVSRLIKLIEDEPEEMMPEGPLEIS